MTAAIRYDRQARIEGWDQSKISNAKVSLIGSNYLTDFTILSLAALGVNDIIWQNNSPKKGSFLSKKEGLEDIVKKINPEINLVVIPFCTSSTASAYFFENSDIIVSTEGSFKYIAPVVEHITENKKYGIISIVKNNSYEFYVYNPKKEDLPRGLLNLKEDSNIFEDVVASNILSGLIVEEIKKAIFGQDTARKIVEYEFGNNCKIKSYPKGKILIVGAGALGNFVGLNLAMLGINQITIMDDDVVEETNLNRQVLFYDSVGKGKAETLAKKIYEISNHKTTPVPINKRFGEEDSISKYGIIIDCVDNFKTRLILSEKAVKSKKILISGGTSYNAGQVATYIPNHTSCINHILNLEESLKEWHKARAETQSCIHQPDPSVIMSNQIIGSLMANELKKAICPKIYGVPVNGYIGYSSESEPRIGSVKLAEKCGD